MVDLEMPLTDIQLPPGRLAPYRSLLVIARLDGDPLGTAVLGVGPAGLVSRARLASGLRRQLRAELREVFAQRGLAFPRSPDLFWLTGIPGGAGRNGDLVAPRRTVSVVVTTCSNPVPLERCVRSVLACDYERPEVIVVENRPGSPATQEMLADRFPNEPRLRYVEEPSPGLSQARNAGLAVAEGEMVAFTDDDVVVDPGWLRRCAQAFERAPDVACVTGLILPRELETESQLLLEQYAGFGKGFQRRTYRLPESRKADPLFPYTPGAIGSGANTVIRADVARKLGGFDTSLGAGTTAVGGEDLDLYIRLLREGCALAYEPGAIVWHQHPDGAAKLRRQVYRYGVGLGATLAKQLVAGPKRRELVRAVPAGIRYARDPASRKNAGKPRNFPRRLNWLERLGMLTGPFAYLTSELVAPSRRRSRPLRGEPRAAPRAAETDGRPVRETATSAQLALVAAAVASCVAAPLLVAFGLPATLRFCAVLALLCLGPGAAVLAAVRGRLELGLVLALSLAISGLAAQSMLWFDVWRPSEFLYGLALACICPLVLELGRLLRARRAAAAPRRPVSEVPRFAAAHAALLVVALVLWGVSLANADLSRMAGIGLLDAMPPTYLVAFGLLLVGFGVAVARDQLPRKLLWAYLGALILVLHGTTPLLYDDPRYAWTYKHLGVIELIANVGAVDREIDIYNNWPGFFALNAWLSGVSGLAPIAYAGWAQLFFNLANVVAVRFALRGVSRDERLLWTATWLFALGNWVGQDYLAPQALGFLLSLVVVGLCLRCSPAAITPRWRWGEWRARSLDRLARALPHRARDDRLPPAPLSPRGALVVGGACFLAVVVSHQFSPVLLILSVIALSLVIRRIPLWIPAAMLVVELWWVALSWPFVQEHFDLIEPGGAGAEAAGRDLSAALPGAELSFYAPGAVIALMGLLALIGAVARLRQGRLDLAPACLIAAPMLGAALQSYGGEGLYRAYLFALPWLAFFAAAACWGPRLRGRSAAVRARRLLAASFAVGACLLFAYFGQELSNRITPDEVKAQAWYEQRASRRAVVLYAAPAVPSYMTERYPRLQVAGPLLSRPAFRGHRLGAADVPRLEQLAERLPQPRVFVMLSRRQEGYARLNGLLPEGSIASLARALDASHTFSLAYRRPGAWIFRYVPATAARRPA
jgi:GT2 family glycosyltransferase